MAVDELEELDVPALSYPTALASVTACWPMHMAICMAQLACARARGVIEEAQNGRRPRSLRREKAMQTAAAELLGWPTGALRTRAIATLIMLDRDSNSQRILVAYAWREKECCYLCVVGCHRMTPTMTAHGDGCGTMEARRARKRKENEGVRLTACVHAAVG